MSQKKQALNVEPVERTYVLFDQQMPIKKDIRGKVEYQANFVRVGEIKATSYTAALQEAVKKGLAAKPVIWGPDTERMRDIFNRPKRSYHDED